ncbi:MAG: CotH kinase family protein, partial [Verrucomicrobiales bacterium]|nr:CotH kinase family protein [Verrucomicrobiales bacterium]
MKPHILCALIGIAHVAHLQATPVISEFLASGPGHDWIEIQNTGDAQINLAGYHLTDDPDNLSRWTFPSTTVAPGNFVVVYASGQDLTDPAGELHANFKLNAAGGFLALSTSEGSTISAFQDYPPQRSGISYGIAISNTVYFKSPSLGKANPARGLLGFVADTKFSVDRGYYEEAFEVAITTATEDATILYTTDGRAPSKGSVFTGPIGEIYAGPITINTTTTLRAIAMKDNYEPSNIDTQTYLFLNDAIRQDGAHLIEEWGDDWGSGEDADYEMDPRIVDDPQWRDTILEDFKTLPVLSLTVEPEDFFSLNKGIYPGKIGQDGIDIPASAELLHPDGKEGFQIDCAVRIVGQTSPQRWKIKKLSMRLRFDGDFGPGTLKYPLYDDPTAVDEFNTLTVDARHNNTWAYNGGSIPAQQREWTQYLRDQTAADLHREMGGLSPHGRYVFTFVNGMFWGMYNLHERPDDAFNASYQGGKRADWVVSRHGDPGNGGVDVSGDAISLYRAFNNFVRDADDPDVYAQIKDQLDVGDFINYMLVNVGLANGDWGHKNYYVSQSPIDGKWRFHSWDAEKVFQRVNDDLTDRNNN